MIVHYSLHKDKEKNISDHFKVKEFACKDGSDKVMVDNNLVVILENIRKTINKPIKIISGYRTGSYNRSCGGADNSYHLLGQAADIQVSGMDVYELAIIAAQHGARGIGTYPVQNFVHIDTRINKKYWKGK